MVPMAGVIVAKRRVYCMKPARLQSIVVRDQNPFTGSGNP